MYISCFVNFWLIKYRSILLLINICAPQNNIFPVKNILQLWAATVLICAFTRVLKIARKKYMQHKIICMNEILEFEEHTLNISRIL